MKMNPALFAVLLVVAMALAGCVTIAPRPVPMPTVSASSAPAAAACQAPGQWIARDGQWVCEQQQTAVVPFYYNPYVPYYYIPPPYYGLGLGFCIGCGGRYRHR